MSDPTLEQELASILQSNFTAICCQTVICGILLYDYILTFGKEVELVWQRPTRALGGTVIFFLNRVVAVGMIILGNLNTDLARYTYASCNYSVIFDVAITLLAYAVWAAVSAIRVHALTRRYWPLTLLTLALALLPPAVDIWLSSTMTFSIAPLGPLVLCMESSPVSTQLNTKVLVAVRTCSMGSDLIVLLVTLYHVCPRPWTRSTLPSRSISRMLLRNGRTLYFIVLAILNILEVIEYLGSATDYVNLFIAPISTIVVSRFLLDIREAAYTYDSEFDATMTQDPSVMTPSLGGKSRMWQTLDLEINSYGAMTGTTDVDQTSRGRDSYTDDQEEEVSN